MTQYESLDLAQSAFSSSIAAYALFLSIVTGYLVTAYLVGRELSRGQVWLLSALFLVVASIAIWSVSSYIFWGVVYSSVAVLEGFEHSAMTPKPWLPVFMAIVNVATAFACLLFMWNVRNRQQKQEDVLSDS